jgi:hypothetical protein
MLLWSKMKIQNKSYSNVMKNQYVWLKRKWKITWLQVLTKKGKGKTCESKYKMNTNLILMCNWKANVHIMIKKPIHGSKLNEKNLIVNTCNQ